MFGGHFRASFSCCRHHPVICGHTHCRWHLHLLPCCETVDSLSMLALRTLLVQPFNVISDLRWSPPFWDISRPRLAFRVARWWLVAPAMLPLKPPPPHTPRPTQEHHYKRISCIVQKPSNEQSQGKSCNCRASMGIWMHQWCLMAPVRPPPSTSVLRGIRRSPVFSQSLSGW